MRFDNTKVQKIFEYARGWATFFTQPLILLFVIIEYAFAKQMDTN